MVKLETIIKEAKQCKAILEKCSTVGVLIEYMEKEGFNPTDVVIETEADNGYLNYGKNINDYPLDTKILSIRLELFPNSCLDFPTYYTKTKELYFDVFDEEVNDMSAFIEDATIKTISKLYKNYVKSMI